MEPADDGWWNLTDPDEPVEYGSEPGLPVEAGLPTIPGDVFGGQWGEPPHLPDVGVDYLSAITPLEEVVVHYNDEVVLTGPLGPGPVIDNDPEMAVDVLSALDEWSDRLAFVRDLLQSTGVRGSMGETMCSVVVERFKEFSVPVTLFERFTTLPNIEHFADDEKAILRAWHRGFDCTGVGTVFGVVRDGMFTGVCLGTPTVATLPSEAADLSLASSIRLMLAVAGGSPNVEVTSNIALGVVRREAARMGMAVTVKRRRASEVQVSGAIILRKHIWTPGAVHAAGEQGLHGRMGHHIPHTKAYRREMQRMMNRPRPPRITVHTPALTIKPNTECPICITTIAPSEGAVLEGCHHTFHRVCAMQWLKDNPTCPMCRTPSTVASLLNEQPATVAVFNGSVPFYRAKLDFATDRAAYVCAVVSKWGWIPRGLADRDARWTVHPPGGVVCNAWVATRDTDTDAPSVLCMDSVTPYTTLEAVAARRSRDLGTPCVPQVATSLELWESS